LKNYDQRMANSWVKRAEKTIKHEMSEISDDSNENFSSSSDRDATILRPTEVFNRKKNLSINAPKKLGK